VFQTALLTIKPNQTTVHMSENDGSDIENSDIQLPETSAPFDEVACGFTDEEFRAACKVISTMNFKRELLSHKYFEPLLEQGRLLFSPLRYELYI
jgi:hypothetical protein